MKKFQNEKKLQDAQALRRKKRDELDMLQNRMKQIHSELDRFSRGDDKYIMRFLSYFMLPFFNHFFLTNGFVHGCYCNIFLLMDRNFLCWIVKQQLYDEIRNFGLNFIGCNR